MSKLNLAKNSGPGTMVAAAFIGPGTVTMCSIAGAQFGYTLLWAMILSIVSTIVLQGMAARLGLIYQNGLAEAIVSQLKSKLVRYLVVVLVVAAIVIGNSAYQAGNITGGVLGLETFFPKLNLSFDRHNLNVLPLILGGVTFILLYIGNYKFIERTLVLLVVLMSFSFIITALMTQPDWGKLITGSFVPTMPEGSLLTIVGLIGTTIVPYNLFLHASLVQEKWKNPSDLKLIKRDTLISISLGGLVSVAIIVCAASIPNATIKSATDLAAGLEPIYGRYANYFLGIGLFAAGLTSAITAPLAAAYVARGCFGWEKNLKSPRFRATWMTVLMIGTFFSMVGKNPIEIISFAQVSNGFLLPIIAFFLWWMVNKSEIMGAYKNTIYQNILSALIILITFLITCRMIYTIFIQ
jgi:Mn2+/Fe2+ NRAMP family transporter